MHVGENEILLVENSGIFCKLVGVYSRKRPCLPLTGRLVYVLHEGEGNFLVFLQNLVAIKSCISCWANYPVLACLEMFPRPTCLIFLVQKKNVCDNAKGHSSDLLNAFLYKTKIG